jgi:hypothetical protein
MAVVSRRDRFGRARRAVAEPPAAAPAPLVLVAAGDGQSPLARLEHDPRRAIREDVIICLICSRPLRQLTNSHLRAHGTTTEAYKRRFGYNARRPLMCLALCRLYSERSIRTGLASHIRERPIVSRPELRALGGRRPLAWEEILTRFEMHRRRRALKSLGGG